MRAASAGAGHRKDGRLRASDSRVLRMAVEAISDVPSPMPQRGGDLSWL